MADQSDVTFQTVATPYLLTKCFSCTPEYEEKLNRMLLETIPQALLSEGCQDHLVFYNPRSQEWVVFSSWENRGDHIRYAQNSLVEIRLQEWMETGKISCRELMNDTFERIE